MTLERGIEDLCALGKRAAAILADQIVDLLIGVLKRDRDLPIRSASEWWRLLADMRGNLADKIHDLVLGHVDRDEVLNELRDRDLLDH
jgi:hypothetical protein